MVDYAKFSDFEIEWHYGGIIWCSIKKLKNHTLKNIIVPEFFYSPTGQRAIVSEIHENAFRRSELETIVLPHTVTAIGHSAFKSCPYLTSVKRTKAKNMNILEVDGCVFAQCTALQIVDLGKIKLRDNGQQFWGCSSLKKFPFDKIADCRIPYMAFMHCPISSAKFNKQMELGSFAFTKIGKLYLYQDFMEELPDWLLDVLKNSKIYVNLNSKLYELAYEGYNVRFL